MHALPSSPFSPWWSGCCRPAAAAARAGPSPSEGVTLDGVVAGGTAALALHASAGSTAAVEAITVTCLENPAITATVDAGGSFTLQGLPAGGFTLVFKQGATEGGRLSFSEVKPNQQITITIALSGTTVTLVEEKRNGIGHGDLEIESERSHGPAQL